jgi:transcriptional regulator with XRE-family HTH domain
MDVNERLGRRLRHLRKMRGLTQEALGEQAGVAAKYLGSVERGRENPTVRLLARLADALDVDLCDLFEAPESEPGSPAVLRRRAGTLLREASGDELRRAVQLLRLLINSK